MAHQFDMKDKCGNFPSNGGQIVEQFLLQEEKNGFNINLYGKNTNRNLLRRKRKLLPGTINSLYTAIESNLFSPNFKTKLLVLSL